MSRNIIEAHGRKYFRDIRKLVKASRQKLWLAYQNEIRPRIHEYRRLSNNQLTANHFRVNDSLNEIQRILERIRQESGEDIFNSLLVAIYVREFAENTNQSARSEFKGQVQAALEGDPTEDEPWLQSFLETAIQENVKWIKSIDRKYHDTIETIVLQGARRNTSLNEMASDIASAGDTALNKARFIARDQTGSLYGDLMKRRHSEAGLRRFRWRSSGDERVRDSHEDLDGQVFVWSEGTVRETKRKDGSVSNRRRIWPGTDYGCRCTPEVIEEDLFSDTEESGVIRMDDTIPERIRSIAKHLKKVEDEVLQIYIDDAKLEVQSEKVAKRYQEKLQRYLAAHLATLDYRRPSTQKIGDLQTSYPSGETEQTKDSLNGTEYGKEYDRILDIARGSKDVRFGVM